VWSNRGLAVVRRRQRVRINSSLRRESIGNGHAVLLEVLLVVADGRQAEPRDREARIDLQHPLEVLAGSRVAPDVHENRGSMMPSGFGRATKAVGTAASALAMSPAC
jgi:hypothetical protein